MLPSLDEFRTPDWVRLVREIETMNPAVRTVKCY